MKRFSWIAALVLILPGMASALQAGPDAIFKRVQEAASSAFPPGTTTYELYWIPTGSKESPEDLTKLISAAKQQRARWVLASDDAQTLKERLLAALGQVDRNGEGTAEIVIVSPLTSDEELTKTAAEQGVTLEFLLIPPAEK